MTIYAFPHCGSRRIRQGALYVGALTGAKEVCRNCHYQGMPLLFDTEEAYQQFLNEIKTGSTASSDPVRLT